MLDLAQDPDKRATLSRWARAAAMAVDVSAVGPRYLALYEDVLRGNTGL